VDGEALSYRCGRWEGSVSRLGRRNRTSADTNDGTLVVDTLGIALAAVGMINPLLAAFIHVSSELTFILNSARLLPDFSRQPHLD
jgi:cation transport ATPase